MIKAILIDDIEHARVTLRKDLETYAKDVEIIGEANGVVEGAKLLKKLQPDILFLDIQMQDGSGFDLLDILPEIHFNIIFITASDAHAIKAFRYAAIDYLLKPVDPDELKTAIEKFKHQQKTNTKGSNEKYQLLKDNLQNQQKVHTKLALNTQEKIHIVNISDIIRCESSGNYTEFFMKENKKLIVTKTMKDYEDLLSQQGFYRVHQSHLINTSYIKEFIKSDEELLMIDQTRIPVSTRRRAEVMKMLEEL